MKSKTKDCLALVLFAILLGLGISLVQADEQPAIAKFIGGWFAVWSEQGPPIVKVENGTAGAVVTAGNLAARVIEINASHLLCTTMTNQNGKTYENYFELTPAGVDQMDFYFWQIERGQTQKLNERHEKLYRGH
jgi:Na+/H+-dicarboxylate symporter